MIYEIEYTIFLKDDIEFRDMLLKLSKKINTILCRSGYAKFHNDYALKPYSFSNLFPVTFDFYRKNNIYKFYFRTFNAEMSFAIEKYLKSNKLFDVICKKVVYQPFRLIRKIETFTPVIFRSRSKNLDFVLGEDDIAEFVEFLEDNLRNKYYTYFKRELNKDKFIKNITFLNKKPHILFLQKNNRIIKFLGVKLKLEVHENVYSSKLLNTALAAGLGAKNALGAGFCKEIK